MAVAYSWLDTPVFTKGIIGEPNLHILLSEAYQTDKTVRLELYSSNMLSTGVSTAITLPANQKEISVNIGDWINANYDSAGLTPGLYMLLVEIQGEGVASIIPLIISESSQSYPADTDKLVEVIVIHRITGEMYTLPPGMANYPADDVFIVFGYYHDPENRLGRLVKIGFGGVDWDSGWHRSVLLKQKLYFNSYCDLASFMLAHTMKMPKSVLGAIISELESFNCSEAIKLLVAGYWGSFSLGYLWSVKYYEENSSVILETLHYVPLGFLDSIKKYIKAGAIGCALGIIGAVAITGVTGGVAGGTIALAGKLCLAGAAASVVYEIYRSDDRETSTNQIVSNARAIHYIVLDAMTTNDKYYSSASEYFNYLVQKYDISSEDASEMENILRGWHNTINAYLKDIDDNAATIIKISSELDSEKDKKLLYALAGLAGGAIIARIVK